MEGGHGESERPGSQLAHTALHTFGERLRWAIEARPPKGRYRGQALFARDLEVRAAQHAKEGVRLQGWTPPSIQSYVHDRAEPSRLFAREAARLCGVRPEWLDHGHGAPTEAMEIERLAAERRRHHVMERVAIEGFETGLGQSFETLSATGQGAFWQLFAALRGSIVEHVTQSETRGTSQDQEDVDRELARRIGAAVVAPLSPLPIQLQRASKHRWGRYVAAACEALYTLHAHQHPAEERPEPAGWRAFLDGRQEENHG